jgi:hypothetical protein
MKKENNIISDLRTIKSNRQSPQFLKHYKEKLFKWFNLRRFENEVGLEDKRTEIGKGIKKIRKKEWI